MNKKKSIKEMRIEREAKALKKNLEKRKTQIAAREKIKAEKSKEKSV